MDAIATALTPAATGRPGTVAPPNFSFLLDQVLVQAEAVDPHTARLTCRVSSGLPAGEAAQRGLLEMHLADVVAGAAEVLWSDAGGALLLSADVHENDEVLARIASLTGATMAWRARLAGDDLPRRAAGPPMGPDLMLLHRYGGLG